jgi:hypothetical protein
VSKVHQKKPSLHKKIPIWRVCKLQNFFAETCFVRYFVAEEDGPKSCLGTASLNADDCPSLEEKGFFELLNEDVAVAELDAKAEANIVHGFGSHRSAVEPWLMRTRIEEHTRGIRKDEMHALVAVLKSAEEEPELFLMLEVMDEILSEAHGWCFDGPECMLT